MNCTYCDTELPGGAMFCGECGRAVAPEAVSSQANPVAPARPVRASEPTPTGAAAVPDPVAGLEADHVPDRAPEPGLVSDVDSEPAHDSRPAPETVAGVRPMPESPPIPAPRPERVDLGAHCEQCGAELGEGDIFCGECGHVTRSASSHFSRPRDTVIIQAVQLERDAASAIPANLDRAAIGPEPHSGLSGLEDGLDDDLDDVEAPRIVSQRRTGARFVLQFSTGESFTISGNGLVGRNPKPEPAEYFDHLVRVLDPSRSVSKTHLEFGQEAGVFWIKDRFSGNGSIIREPEGDPVRCQPDRRYRIVRGARVEIGEQFFIVS